MKVWELMEKCAEVGISISVHGEIVSLEGDPAVVAEYAPLLRPYKAEIIESADLTPDEWLELIHALDCLIDRYCLGHRLSDFGRERILATRRHQSLISIPESFEWFWRELESLRTNAGQGSTRENIDYE
ncbi:hypothetical protein ABC383_07865 [Noviherbaspirillum sp. 1P10PC]|uniref:hypothetical protein n=1 Tax=Noviherbaspirillum sp. 1P10PC TaxID=3132292 RepID=UPI00399FA530